MNRYSIKIVLHFNKIKRRDNKIFLRFIFVDVFN